LLFLHVSPSFETTGFLPLIKAVIRASRSIGDSGIPLTRMDIRFDDFAIIFILKNWTLTAWTFDTLIAP
jgi:hypothetical protein